MFYLSLNPIVTLCLPHRAFVDYIDNINTVSYFDSVIKSIVDYVQIN